MTERYSLDIYDKLREIPQEGLHAEIIPHTLQFARPSRTSRGTMTQHQVHIIRLSYTDQPGVYGLGEFAPLPGLSPDDGNKGLAFAWDIIRQINETSQIPEIPPDYPALKFALETAALDLNQGGEQKLFPSKFTEGNELIRINGLIWMGDPQYMIDQVNRKIQDGFTCLKLKIGALPLREELYILGQIRNVFTAEELEIRLDANGAFHPEEALDILHEYSAFDIHSIEQPIPVGWHTEMAELCNNSPIPVALDEELIRITEWEEKEELLETILPSYIILKPTLAGGYTGSQDWINIAEEKNIGWWITSALESNIGLNAIAQWAFTLQNPIPQGLGTGQLYTNNFESPLSIDGEYLKTDPARKWKFPF